MACSADRFRALVVDMARPLRINLADGWYHCMHRGLERRKIFKEPYDCAVFLRLLGETVERFRFVVHAYCLMDNHYHALIQTPEANLSQGMQWLGLSYSSYFNARHNRAGPLFQGRFKSISVEEGKWAYELSLYVHLNPVRTVSHGLGKKRSRAERLGIGPPASSEEATARMQTLRMYRSSSYRAYAGYEQGPEWLTVSEIRRRARGIERGEAARYRARVQDLLRAGADVSQQESFRDALGIGSAEFIARLKQIGGKGNRETERRGRLKGRLSFETVLKAVAEARGEPADRWLHRHGDWGKWLTLKLAREATGMTLRELGGVMGGMDYAAVCMGLRRFDERMKQKNGGETLNETYKRIRKMLYV